MIGLIIWLVICFAWLLYETDWMRVRLPVGATIIEQPKRKWQFLKYGDDALMLCQQCQYGSRLHSWRTCGKDKDRWFGWKLPAQTIKAWGSTLNLNEGCNVKRAKLLRDIAKAQKPTKPHDPYPISHFETQTCFPLPEGYNARAYVAMEYFEPSIELLVDGKPVANINGDHKRGMIRELVRQYK